MNIIDSLLILGGYLLGSLSSAIVVCRLAGLPDPRTQGSGNPGATNVLRLGGKKLAALVLVGDFLKGVLAVGLAVALTHDDNVVAAAGFAAFIGHLYPVFFGFRGGKGVATWFGVMLGLSWQICAAMALTWLLVVKVSKISSLSGLTAAALTPLYVWWLDPRPPVLIAAIAMSVLMYWRHRTNIRKLIAGTER